MCRKLTRMPSGVNLPLSEVIMSRRQGSDTVMLVNWIFFALWMLGVLLAFAAATIGDDSGASTPTWLIVLIVASVSFLVVGLFGLWLRMLLHWRHSALVNRRAWFWALVLGGPIGGLAYFAQVGSRPPVQQSNPHTPAA